MPTTRTATADDLPYWDYRYDAPQLMVPYTLDANDMRFATPQGFNSGQQFYEYLKDSFDVLYAEGGTHAVGRPALPTSPDARAGQRRWRDFLTTWPGTRRPGLAAASILPSIGVRIIRRSYEQASGNDHK